MRGFTIGRVLRSESHPAGHAARIAQIRNS